MSCAAAATLAWQPSHRCGHQLRSLGLPLLSAYQKKLCHWHRQTKRGQQKKLCSSTAGNFKPTREKAKTYIARGQTIVPKDIMQKNAFLTAFTNKTGSILNLSEKMRSLIECKPFTALLRAEKFVWQWQHDSIA